MKNEKRSKVIAALKKGHSADHCKAIAKKFKVKESYVHYVRAEYAKEVGYKKRAYRGNGKKRPVVTLAITSKPGKRGASKRHAAKPIGLRGTAVKVLTDHGNRLPDGEREFFRAALGLVLTEG